MKKFLGFAIVLFCLQGSNSVPTPCSCVAPVECAEVVRIDGCSTSEPCGTRPGWAPTPDVASHLFSAYAVEAS